MSNAESGVGARSPNGQSDAGRHGRSHAHVIEDAAGFEMDQGASMQVFRARWQLFLPTLAVAILYAGTWAYLHWSGYGHYAVARLAVIVLAVGVPLLAAQAFLRYQTIRLQVLPDDVRYHSGWPRDLPVDMPCELIERVRVKTGISGILFGGGTLIMDLRTGEKAVVADLSDPEAARMQIEKRLAGRGEEPATQAG
jgi:hypothetical protein